MASEAELLSIASLEAMATGLPMLLADAMALPELVEPRARTVICSSPAIRVKRRGRWTGCWRSGADGSRWERASLETGKGAQH